MSQGQDSARAFQVGTIAVSTRPLAVGAALIGVATMAGASARQNGLPAGARTP